MPIMEGEKVAMYVTYVTHNGQGDTRFFADPQIIRFWSSLTPNWSECYWIVPGTIGYDNE